MSVDRSFYGMSEGMPPGIEATIAAIYGQLALCTKE